MKFPVPLASGVSNLWDRVLYWQFRLTVPLNKMRVDSVWFGNHIFFGLLGGKKINLGCVCMAVHTESMGCVVERRAGEGPAAPVSLRNSQRRVWGPGSPTEPGRRWREENASGGRVLETASRLSSQGCTACSHTALRRGWRFIIPTRTPTYLLGQLPIGYHTSQLHEK